MMPDAEAALLRHVLETPEAAVPGDAREAARVFILDTLAVGIAGDVVLSAARERREVGGQPLAVRAVKPERRHRRRNDARVGGREVVVGEAQAFEFR